MGTLEVAELLGVRERTVTRMIHEGKIPATRQGRAWAVTAKLSDLTMSYTKGKHRRKRTTPEVPKGRMLLGEVCDILGMDRRRVAEMILGGELAGHKSQGRWYVTEASLHKYQKEQESDLQLQASVRQVCLDDREDVSYDDLPYTKGEHLAWWGIEDNLTPIPPIRLRPVDQTEVMRQAGPISRGWGTRD